MLQHTGDHPLDGPLASLSTLGIEHFSRIDNDVSFLVDAALIERHVRRSNVLSILVAPAAPPLDRGRKDPPVRSFIASGPWVHSLQEGVEGGDDACYRALHRALAGEIDVPEIAIFNGVARDESHFPAADIEVVIPHKGSRRHLEVCLSGVNAQSIDCRAAVCLDESPDWRPVQCGDRVRMFRAEDPPVGPYPIRQHLAMNSSAEFIAFQDSDDFSVRSRLCELVSACVRTGCDVVGSHELRLDEIERTVLPVRFPLDVNAALKESAAHAQLFPTTVARVSTFTQLGGFSTDRMFGADSEYLLRSHLLGARIVNIDRFVYIRRRRPGSLTTDPATALGSPVRVELSRRWVHDFNEIRNRRLSLESSSLALRAGATVKVSGLGVTEE